MYVYAALVTLMSTRMTEGKSEMPSVHGLSYVDFEILSVDVPLRNVGRKTSDLLYRATSITSLVFLVYSKDSSMKTSENCYIGYPLSLFLLRSRSN